jgi:hypothetical protein
MPASRILEGSLPKQHRQAATCFWRPTTTQNVARSGISRAKTLALQELMVEAAKRQQVEG